MLIFGDPWWAEVFSVANVAFAALAAWFSFNRARRVSGWFRVLLTLLGLVGVYWAVLYVWVFFTPAGAYDGVSFGRVLVRPAFTFTLALMASLSVFRRSRGD